MTTSHHIDCLAVNNATQNDPFYDDISVTQQLWRQHNIHRTGNQLTPFMQLINADSALTMHILYAFLPAQSTTSQRHDLRRQTHSFQLPGHSSSLSDCNFLTCVLRQNCH